jgi:hypothetical protein
MLMLVYCVLFFFRNNFFSFSDTSTDYSLVLDKELLEILKSHGSGHHVHVAEGTWRPLVVEVGALGSVTGVSKIAASVITPLADHNVSVFCVSTNQDDYVLVREQELHKALSCLSGMFRIVSDSETWRDQSLVESVICKTTVYPSPTSHLKSIMHPCDPVPRPIVHPYICSKSSFNICSIVPQALPSVGMVLLDLMLYNKRSTVEGSFFSLSIVDDDISMVIDCRDIDRFPEGSLYHTEGTWKLLRIGEGPLGFDECGIVAQVSAPLAHAEISTYYICTYFTDHTLLFNVRDWMSAIHRYTVQGHTLPENTIGKALRLLHERLSSKISNEVHVGTEGMLASAVETVPADSLLENGLHASAVGLGCDGLSFGAVNGVESNGILINSSI